MSLELEFISVLPFAGIYEAGKKYIYRMKLKQTWNCGSYTTPNLSFIFILYALHRARSYVGIFKKKYK